MHIPSRPICFLRWGIFVLFVPMSVFILSLCMSLWSTRCVCTHYTLYQTDTPHLYNVSTRFIIVAPLRSIYRRWYHQHAGSNDSEILCTGAQRILSAVKFNIYCCVLTAKSKALSWTFAESLSSHNQLWCVKRAVRSEKSFRDNSFSSYPLHSFKCCFPCTCSSICCWWSVRS